MATTRELRRRIRSVKTTRQITRAMELVASSKLRGAVKAASASQQYSKGLVDVLAHVLGQAEDVRNPLLKPTTGTKVLAVVFSSDQGLAGMFHSNNFKASLLFSPDTQYYVLGKRLSASLKRVKRILVPHDTVLSRTLHASEVTPIMQDIVRLYLTGEYRSVQLIATQYHSALTQKTITTELLPLSLQSRQPTTVQTLLIEPDVNQVVDALIIQTLTAQLLEAARQTRASEFAIRRMAMHSATENAGELIEKYTLAYNRARQAAITTEIAEIVGGAAALSR